MAKGYEMVAAGLRQMAEAGMEMPELPTPTEKAEATPAPKNEEKKIKKKKIG